MRAYGTTMTTALLTLVFLAPAMATAAAVSIAMPEPTQFVPSVDTWSPAPTAAAQLPFDLFKRESNHDYTCGFVSGSSERPVTCQTPTQTCATNTYFGIHGCCDPDSTSACTIATSCIASTAMSASCTDAACSSDAAIAKCTASSAPACYEWHFVYEKMVMTQHGCAESGFTSTAYHTLGMTVSSSISSSGEADRERTVTATVTQDSSSTPTAESPSSSDHDSLSGPSIGAIIGGTIGACLFLSFIAFVIFLAWHRRRTNNANPATHSPHSNYNNSNSTVVEINSHGFSSPPCFTPTSELASPASPILYHHESRNDSLKAWDGERGGLVTSETETLQYPGMRVERRGIAEVDGWMRPVEAPAATSEK